MRKSPNLTDSHKLERLVWCLKNKNTDFSRYIFVDETTIRVFDRPLYHVRYPTKYPKSLPCSSKFEAKLNIWGGISVQGATEFAVNKTFFLYIFYLIIKRFLVKIWILNFTGKFRPIYYSLLGLWDMILILNFIKTMTQNIHPLYAKCY